MPPAQAHLVQIAVREGMVKVMDAVLFLYPQELPPAQSDNHSQYSLHRTAYSSSSPSPQPPRTISVAFPPNHDQLVEMRTDSVGSI